MEGFIKKLVTLVLEKGYDFHSLTFVLPSKRTETYIKEEIFHCLDKPFFSPRFLTIDQFVSELSSLNQIDSVDLVFMFFDVYKKQGGIDDFDSFLKWAPTFLSDCNEIDQNLVEPSQIFQNLRNIKELEQWSFGENKVLSQNQEEFLKFWMQLFDLYISLKKELEEKQLGYRGAMFREVNEDLQLKIEESFANQKFVFAGFNALSRAETQIIKKLIAANRAILVLETDEFTYSNESHEAAKFIRQTIENIPEAILFKNDDLLKNNKNIYAIQCSHEVSMLKVAQGELVKLSSEELSKTALILASEALIVPAIRHLPKSIGLANITLGLPIKFTVIKTWVDLVFEFQNNQAYFGTDAVYHKSFSALLRHPFMLLCQNELDLSLNTDLEDQIIRFNKIFIKPDLTKYSDRFRRIFEFMTIPWNFDFSMALERILQMNKEIFALLDSNDHLIERSAMFHFHKAIQQFLEIWNSGNVPEMSLTSFERFFNLRWKKESVSYYGNPTNGLQIMGMLETRLLSFDRLIFVGFNDGDLPPKNVVDSFIPMDIRRFYGLPLPAEKDAIFAHHFYRLLYQAREVSLIYCNNKGDDFSRSEPSRYLNQIALELSPLSSINFYANSYDLPVTIPSRELSFEMNEAVRDRILNYFEQGVSASGLKKFLECPKDFFFRYVLKIGEAEEVEEDLESSSFGTIVHDTLEELYRPFADQGRQILPVDLDKMLAIMDGIVAKKFGEMFQSEKEATERGALYFAEVAAKKQVKRFLINEKQHLIDNPDKPLFIVSIEKEYEKECEIHDISGTRKITIKGKIDRVDHFGDALRIVDYKTGSCERSKVTISKGVYGELAEQLKLGEIDADLPINIEFDRGYLLQLLVYIFIFSRGNERKPDEVGIISMRNMEEGFQKLQVSTTRGKYEPMVINQNVVDFVERYLVHLTEKILSQKTFEHNEKSKYCKNC